MKVLLICSGGMSTHILINSIIKEAQKLGFSNFSADAIGTNEMEEYEKDFDVLLVAPQIRHKFDELKQFADSKNKKIYQIEMTEYSPMGAKKLVQKVNSLMEDK